MQTESFRLEQPVTGLREKVTSHRFVTLPPGSILTVVRPSFCMGLVEAQWDGEVVEVFLRDLQERGVLVSNSGITSSREFVD
jgi:hypothetical protein